MSYDSSFDLPSSASGSRLLSDSSHLPPASDADLSLSELSLNPAPETNHRRPFSIIPQRKHELDHSFADETVLADETALFEHDDEEHGVVDGATEDDEEARRSTAARTHEERLQHDIFMLRKMNATLEGFHEALKVTRKNREASPIVHSCRI
jgi:hypothetical protein